MFVSFVWTSCSLWFKSAGAGKVSMTRPWQKNQHITAGEAFLSIVPEESAQITGKTLDFSQEMSGTVKIITEDLRLIERFFNPIKALIKR